MATVARDRDDHLTVSPISREQAFKALAELGIHGALIHPGLDQSRLHMLEIERLHCDCREGAIFLQNLGL